MKFPSLQSELYEVYLFFVRFAHDGSYLADSSAAK